MKTFFDETHINKNKISNRFFVAPMSRVSAEFSGIPTEEMAAYYTGFAEGGFGGIITEGLYTDEHYSRSYPNQPGLVSEAQIRAWQHITGAIKKHNSVVIAQLMHAGSISQVLERTKAPSRITPLGKKLAAYGGGDGPFPIPDEMDEKDVRNMKDGFIRAAKNAVKAGFHGIELHAANGYLLDQFHTDYLNLRTDKYGQTVENRLRITTEITEEIRNQVPSDFIVGLRISEGKVNNLSHRWKGGSQTAREILNQIRKMPVDYLHIAAEHYGWKEECRYEDGTSLTGLARDILECPVMANGGLHDLDLSRELLETNQADLFSIGKYALSNPDFVRKVKHNIPLTPFRKELLYPNPSLFTDEKHRMYLDEQHRMV
ncbi:NADH:flavin oxidoreductase [Sinomicrobium weinanense]|uniref:NADH:flavin oxidoreductase n=1 Tax=Sinomicrobium weinanense TaxID=2842200 RepID=A0A926JPE6_9FLAO|nr:NADH:flavin oxidoreductase [Sinomicrobium weinanense]MBC9795028.1 NADH:flavin oxidoreductase [Sinomicrobium weinanense]MBU3125111.1 NADH:flavin oxidoreductase [Sinomicrobium weinanense]